MSGMHGSRDTAVRMHALQNLVLEFALRCERTRARAKGHKQNLVATRAAANPDSRGGDGCLRQDSHQPSQHRGALGALSSGRGWVSERVDGLAEQKALVLDALAPLGEGAVQGGSGAIYLFCKLPPGVDDDMAAVRYLVEAHGVCLIPGSGCGLPGHVRVCYANLSLEKTKEAAARLRAGLTELAAGGVDLSSV